MDENIYLVDIDNLIIIEENGQRNECVDVGWHFNSKDMTILGERFALIIM